jgi:flagellar hook-basal body complex protein FliE
VSIAAIGAVGGITPPSGIGAATGAAGATGAGTDFATQLGSGLQNLQGLQDKADHLAVQAATGSLTDVHDYMIASSEASLATELTVAVRNKAIDAFNEIMRMQA